MRRLLFVVVAALMLAVAGCSSSPSAGSTPSPTQLTSSAPATTPTPAATPSPAAPDATCLNGRYQLVRYVGARRIYGTGEGGDVTITFDDGSYLLHGAGKDPIKVTLAGQTADLLVNGTLSGEYRVAGYQATLTAGESTGSATLSIGPLQESVSMEQVGSVLASNGAAGLACANDALIITLQDLRLEFGKV